MTVGISRGSVERSWWTDSPGDAVAVDAQTAVSPKLREFGGATVAWTVTGDDDLLDDRRPLPPGLPPEQNDAVGELERFIDVVGDEEHGRGCCGVNVEKEVLHFETRECIERTERLVEQQDTGISGECPGEGCPLCHSPGDLAWAVPGKVGQADEVDEFTDAGSAFSARCFPGRPSATLSVTLRHGSRRGSWNPTAVRSSKSATV